MKKAAAIVTTAALISVVGAGSALAGRIDNRQNNQRARIAHGIHSGALTWSEARLLRKEQGRIHRVERRAWADGHLNRRERLRLERLQDRASRHIYRLKHNRRTR